MEKFLEHIQEAENIIRKIDHLVYVTFPLVKDKRLLLKSITESKRAIVSCINSILQYEYLYRRIRIYKDPGLNFQTFKNKCSKRYGINENEIKLINHLFEVSKKHEQSSFEFIKQDKIIILSEKLQPETIPIEKTKEFLVLAKDILYKTKNTIKQNFNKI